MSTTASWDKSLSLTADGSTVTETIENFVEAIDAPDSAAEPFVELVEAMAGELEKTRRELSEAHQRIDDLEEHLADQEDVDEIEERVSDLEDHSEKCQDHRTTLQRDVAALQDDNQGATPTPDTDETTLHDTIETNLGQIVALPEHIADEELTANQQRARFIAKDIRDYSSKAPAGRVIKSSEIRKVLAARDNSNPHTETISRVIDFLRDFGEGEVQVVKRRGEKRVVFEESLVERIEEIGDQSITTSVMGKPLGV